MIVLAALLAAPALTAPSQGPAELFTAACTQGQVVLAKGSAAPATYGALPRGARDVLGQSAAPLADPQTYPGPPRDADVPNSIFAVGPGDAMFLMVPPADAGAGRFAHSCAVVWKGEHFKDARAAILPNPPEMLSGQSPEISPNGLAFVGTVVGDLYLSATTLRGWTVLKAVPRAEAPLPGAQ